jgi:hypothetical protein
VIVVDTLRCKDFSMPQAHNSELSHGYRDTFLSVLAIIVAAVALAACGSSGASPSAAGSSATAQGVKATDCIRSHGVPSLSDRNGRARRARC